MEYLLKTYRIKKLKIKIKNMLTTNLEMLLFKRFVPEKFTTGIQPAKNTSGIINGRNTKLQYGTPTEIFSNPIKSNNNGYIVPSNKKQSKTKNTKKIIKFIPETKIKLSHVRNVSKV